MAKKSPAEHDKHDKEHHHECHKKHGWFSWLWGGHHGKHHHDHHHMLKDGRRHGHHDHMHKDGHHGHAHGSWFGWGKKHRGHDFDAMFWPPGSMEQCLAGPGPVDVKALSANNYAKFGAYKQCYTEEIA